MVELDIKQRLEEIFKEDPLRKEISINKLEDYLYTENILGMHTETTYSTTEAAEIIGRNDSTLRNYFRTDLLSYILPDRQGKFYRLNYVSVFKMHMILLLVEKANKATADLTYYLGITHSVSEVRTDKVYQRNRENTNLPSAGIEEIKAQIINEVEDNLKELKKIILIQNTNFSNKSDEHKLDSLKNQYQIILQEINAIEKEIELLEIKKENKLIESKYYKMLDHSLRQTRAGSVSKKKGFLASLFGGSEKDEEVDIDKIMEEAMIAAEQVSSTTTDETIDSKLKELKEFKKKEEEKLKNLYEKIKFQEKEVEKSKGKVDFLNSPKFDDEMVDQLLLEKSKPPKNE